MPDHRGIEVPTNIRLVAYYAMAVGLLMGLQWGFFLLTGNVPSAGYFAEHGEWGMVTMFAVVLLLTLLCVWKLVKNVDGTGNVSRNDAQP